MPAAAASSSPKASWVCVASAEGPAAPAVPSAHLRVSHGPSSPVIPPSAAQDVTSSMRLPSSSADVTLVLGDINANRATRAAINVTFDTLARRMLLDPWLPLSGTINPSAVRRGQ